MRGIPLQRDVFLFPADFLLTVYIFRSKSSHHLIMKNSFFTSNLFAFVLIVCSLSCKQKEQTAFSNIPTELNLKRGDLISCGPTEGEFGVVNFDFTCNSALKTEFNLGIKLLHSFEYDEAEKVFAKILEKEPECPMAYWGVAMSNFHPLWMPPTESELKKGAKAAELAKSKTGSSTKELLYIDAIGSFYKDWETLDHRTRTLAFEKGMEALYNQYPNDNEIAVFYALSLTAAADPADKTYSKQKKAGAILGGLYNKYPDHPGVVHYTIHTFDSPELAELALPAARKYAGLAPSSAHALHMPSHIFTRLGLWNESIKTNLSSVSSAQCYAKSAGIKGHWDEEIHSLDYLVYAYLQNGDNEQAKKQVDYLRTIHEVFPDNFKVAYSFAAIPARYVLENKHWEDAAKLESHDKSFAWENYPWQHSIILFTRLLGLVNTGNLAGANTELEQLNKMHQKLVELKDDYKANQVDIQRKAGLAWIRCKEGKNEEALLLMTQARDMEDKTGKHPVTPGEVVPARQLYADLLLAMDQPAKALLAYEADLEKRPNRFNSVYGAALAAEKAGDRVNAEKYYNQILSIAVKNSDRQEIVKAKQFLKKV